jgi:hypothetical protein
MLVSTSPEKRRCWSTSPRRDRVEAVTDLADDRALAACSTLDTPNCTADWLLARCSSPSSMLRRTGETADWALRLAVIASISLAEARRLFGQFADLVGDDREAAALFAARAPLRSPRSATSRLVCSAMSLTSQGHLRDRLGVADEVIDRAGHFLDQRVRRCPFRRAGSAGCGVPSLARARLSCDWCWHAFGRSRAIDEILATSCSTAAAASLERSFCSSELWRHARRHCSTALRRGRQPGWPSRGPGGPAG